jgi:hypothetical protein
MIKNMSAQRNKKVPALTVTTALVVLIAAFVVIVGFIKMSVPAQSLVPASANPTGKNIPLAGPARSLGTNTPAISSHDLPAPPAPPAPSKVSADQQKILDSLTAKPAK